MSAVNGPTLKINGKVWKTEDVRPMRTGLAEDKEIAALKGDGLDHIGFRIDNQDYLAIGQWSNTPKPSAKVEFNGKTGAVVRLENETNHAWEICGKVWDHVVDEFSKINIGSTESLAVMGGVGALNGIRLFATFKATGFLSFGGVLGGIITSLLAPLALFGLNALVRGAFAGLKDKQPVNYQPYLNATNPNGTPATPGPTPTPTPAPAPASSTPSTPAAPAGPTAPAMPPADGARH